MIFELTKSETEFLKKTAFSPEFKDTIGRLNPLLTALHTHLEEARPFNVTKPVMESESGDHLTFYFADHLKNAVATFDGVVTDLNKVGDITQPITTREQLQNLFDAVKNARVAFTSRAFDNVHNSIQSMHDVYRNKDGVALEGSERFPASAPKDSIMPILDQLQTSGETNRLSLEAIDRRISKVLTLLRTADLFNAALAKLERTEATARENNITIKRGEVDQILIDVGKETVADPKLTIQEGGQNSLEVAMHGISLLQKRLETALAPAPAPAVDPYAEGVAILRALTWHRVVGTDTVIVLADPNTLHNNSTFQALMRHKLFSVGLPMDEVEKLDPPISKSEEPFFDREFGAGRHYKFAISGEEALQTLAKLGCTIPGIDGNNPATRPVAGAPQISAPVVSR